MLVTVRALFALGMLACGGLMVSPAALAAGPVNDLIVVSDGLWVRLNGTWQKLDDKRPRAVAACPQFNSPDRIYASFAGEGLKYTVVNAGAPSANWVTSRADIVPLALAAGDTDGNGRCDLGALVAGAPPSIEFLLNLNERWWVTYGSRVFAIAFGNFDGSPNDDVVAMIPEGVHIGFNNLGLLNYSTRNVFGPVGKKVATGDIDGDGRDEIVLVRDLHGNGTPLVAFLAPEVGHNGQALPTNLGPAANLSGPLAVGNLDADPREDILFNGDPPGLWALYNGAGPAVKIDSSIPSQLVIVDLNNDGKNDIVASFLGHGVWRRSGGATTFTRLLAGNVVSITPCACD